MNRRRIVVLAGGALAAAGAVVVGLATAGQADREDPKPTGDPSGATVHEVTDKPEDVEKYWTKERMENAEPAPMPAPPGEDGQP